MLAQRRRRWANINTILVRCLMFAWNGMYTQRGRLTRCAQINHYYWLFDWYSSSITMITASLYMLYAYHQICTAVQNKKAVYAYFASEQILPFAFAKQCGCILSCKAKNAVTTVHLNINMINKNILYILDIKQLP